jgi:hypothetical protein
VTLPPGRAKLTTSPVPSGSDTAAKTIGIVLVACLAASVAGNRRHNDINFKPDQFLSKGTKPIKVTFCKPVLDYDVLSLDIAKLLQPLAKRLIAR